MSADDYPDHWKPAHVRQAEAEALRQVAARQRALDDQRIAQATSGSSGHLGAVVPPSPQDAYPSNWLSHTKGVEL